MLRDIETIIKENKDIDFIRVYELIGSPQTYKMSLPSFMKPKCEVLKASINEDNEFKEPNDQCLTYVKLLFFSKIFKNIMEVIKDLLQN